MKGAAQYLAHKPAVRKVCGNETQEEGTKARDSLPLPLSVSVSPPSLSKGPQVAETRVLLEIMAPVSFSISTANS